MNLSVESIIIGGIPLLNPSSNPNPANAKASSMAFTHSLAFQNLFQPRQHVYRALSLPPPPPLGLRLHSISLLPQSFRNRTTVQVFSFAASHEDSKPSDVGVEKAKNDLKDGAEESQEAWKKTLDSFKEQALKMQSVSQEAYEVYSQKAMVILKETSEKLKVQAEKARQDLSVIAKEISEESKEFLSNAAENSPEPVKDIVETFASSTDELHEVSKVRDFYFGIPYGALLSAGGFLWFMFTGSVSAIRFGVILGSTLLALSISSLRSWKKGESSSLVLKGQAAISAILFLREVRLLFCRPCIANLITTSVSFAAVAFYAYRIIMDRKQSKGSNLERGAES